MLVSGGFLGALLAATAYACNPLQGQCSPVTALASSFREDFTLESPYFDEVKATGLSYSSDGLKFEIAKRFDNPSIKSNFYIMFGKVEVVLQAAKGQGIVSSFYLQSDDLDEIDIELFGGDAYEFQSNWFSKGDTTTYDRGEYHATSSSPLENFHTYTIEWTKDFITWSLDGSVVRTLKPDNGQGFPQSPMYIMAGVWAGGDPSNEIGTIEWAGGLTDYSELPFDMYIKSVIVADYSTGSEYEYTDTSGEWTSIKAIDGEVNGRESQALEDFQNLQNGGSVSNSVRSSSSKLTTSSASTSTSLSSSLSLTSATTSSLTFSSSLSLTSSKAWTTSSSTALQSVSLRSKSTSLLSLATSTSSTKASIAFSLDSSFGTQTQSLQALASIHIVDNSATGLTDSSTSTPASNSAISNKSTLTTVATLSAAPTSNISLAQGQENLSSRKAIHCWFTFLVVATYWL